MAQNKDGHFSATNEGFFLFSNRILALRSSVGSTFRRRSSLKTIAHRSSHLLFSDLRQYSIRKTSFIHVFPFRPSLFPKNILHVSTFLPLYENLY